MPDPAPSDDTLKGLVEGLVSGPAGLERLKEEARAKRRGMFTEWQDAGRKPDPSPESAPLAPTPAPRPAAAPAPAPAFDPAPLLEGMLEVRARLSGLESGMGALSSRLDRLEREAARPVPSPSADPGALAQLGERLDASEQFLKEALERSLREVASRLSDAERAASEASARAGRLEGELDGLRQEAAARPVPAGGAPVPGAAVEALAGRIERLELSSARPAEAPAAERAVRELASRLEASERAAGEASLRAGRLESELAGLRRELASRPTAEAPVPGAALDALAGEIQAVRRAWLESLRRSLARG